MSSPILSSHLREPDSRRPLLFSLLLHALVLVLFSLGVSLLPVDTLLVVGSGLGGGQGGEVIPVGLAAEVGGGEGMYKPSITPRPQAVQLPPPPPSQPEVASPPPTQEEFVQPQQPPKKPSSQVEEPKPTPSRTAPPSAPARSSPPAASRTDTPPAQGVPREPDPGSGGPGGAGAGSQGGFGGGVGVNIGPGTGEGSIDSWYVRQVEQRVGRNWLRTSLGQLERPVQTVIRFEVRADGEIENVELERSSGIRSVDLAAQRAVRASNPLPPLPLELRGRRVRFVAYFEYPPR